jgi:endonuclease YncB( thermonuclease family)
LLLLAAAGAWGSERCIAIDGDTLLCNQRKVRLANVYAAELNQAGGASAKKRLRARIASGEVTLKPIATDRYGRLLAEVYVDGRRIEQADIGPRTGNGSARGRETRPLRDPASL